MKELFPYFTNDGSVGLYSKDADDIYHSATGALTEAYEKFILPAELIDSLYNRDELKILDICYGIGYNSKSVLNVLLEFFNLKNKIISKNLFSKFFSSKNSKNLYSSTIYNAPIYTDNIFNKILSKKNKIYIKAIDTDKILCFLSPFFKIKGKNKKMLFGNEKINKYLSEKSKSKYKLNKEINIYIYNLLKKQENDFLNNSEIDEILSNKNLAQFFDAPIVTLYNFDKILSNSKGLLRHILDFLHNIYYRYVTGRYKKGLEWLYSNEFNIDYEFGDGRQIIMQDKSKYDLIFLDAFTPQKCPCLWTKEFFELLYEHLSDDGRLLTYTSSASVRGAMIAAGFYVGKIKNNFTNGFVGTICTKNKALIKYDLSEFDLGLLKTSAGIFYRDKNLNALNEAIIAARKRDVEKSGLLSSTKYKLMYNSSEGVIYE